MVKTVISNTKDLVDNYIALAEDLPTQLRILEGPLSSSCPVKLKKKISFKKKLDYLTMKQEFLLFTFPTFLLALWPLCIMSTPLKNPVKYHNS